MTQEENETHRKRHRLRERLRLDLPNFVPYRITTLAALIRRALHESIATIPA